MMATNQSILGRVTINTLHDDVLIDIFHFCVDDWNDETHAGRWYILVHVCQRWRYVVFASPRRLNLRLWYRGERPMSEMLDVWPVLPVVIGPTTYSFSNYRNITALLDSEYHHRICAITLNILTSFWGTFTAAMQKPFPELTSLDIWVDRDRATSVPVPDSFLGGSAPLLRHLRLTNCSFRGLPKLLSSSDHLASLHLRYIPYSGFLSPQALVTALSVTSRLESLCLEFERPRSRRGRANSLPRPSTRSPLPRVNEYLEDLLAQIEVPLLDHLNVMLFVDPNFVVPQLYQLISHTESFKTCDKGSLRAFDGAIELAIFREEVHDSPDLSLEIISRQLYGHLPFMARVCSSPLSPLSTLTRLDIGDFGNIVENETPQWLELLDPFTSVTDLRLGKTVGPRVCQALEELAEERVTEVLPALRNIFLRNLGPSESVPEFIEGFVAARQLFGHPVTVFPWKTV
ncbi:hypothetical protein F5148DRAFT_623515 [Russula earlei]|uniref:Uncharacterized protein n=1 Tax=Russula earlei TaxID=71964 RepID=A0ACC0UGL8_9AGAM|nr:hypothetical protein F5148DRAFT_623515 [Russula earlei]